MRGPRASDIVCVCAALGSAGCAPALAGTNDAALDFEVTPAAEAPVTEAPAPGSDLAQRVKARLDAADIAASVDVERPGAVRVVTDAEAASAVDQLLGWPGGIAAYRVDDDVTLAPRPAATRDLRARSRVRPEGGTERWWEGSSDAVHRLVSETPVDARHLAFAERVSDDLWRTRVVQTPALQSLGGAVAPFTAIELAAHGRALALTLPSGARPALAALESIAPAASVALVRGRSLLATTSLDRALATPLVVSFGDGLRAFTRAGEERRLLESPALPPLRRAAARKLPPRWGLAAACALLPFALSLAWLLFVRRFDRARPEPWWLVLATFALGCLSVVPAAALEMLCVVASPWLDPSLVTFGGQAWSLPVAIPVFALVVGVAEEGSKLLAAWSLAGHRPEFDEPVDGIVYGCAAALGFAAAENVKYFAIGRMTGTVIALRAFVTVPAHMFFGAVWGYAWGRSLVSRRASVLAFLGLAALAHGSFDALLSVDGGQGVAAWLVAGLGVAFFEMLRRALRHGAVRRPSGDAPATEPVPPSGLPRQYFRVGSRLQFTACAAAMLTLASALVVLGMAYEGLHERVGVVFVAIATAILALFGVAAYGVTSTIPLDVAVDAQGVTYAGRRVPWGAVFDARVEDVASRAFVVVRSAGGDLRVGPTAERRASPRRRDHPEPRARARSQSTLTSSTSNTSPALAGMLGGLPFSP